jgi:hypothetical protein
MGAANSFVAFGKALTTGEDALAAWGKTILGAFGDILIQLGTQVLAVGIGMSAVPILFGFQGAGAVLAGIAMLTAGGILKGVSGGAGASATQTTAGPVVGGNPVGGGFETPDIPEPEELQENTRVQVVINGSVLDRRETGLAIAEVINESFGTNGLVLAT